MNKSKLRLATALLSVALLPASQAFAHVTSANGGGSNGPVFTDSPQTLAKGKAAAAITYQRFDLDAFSDEFLEDVAIAGFEEVHNTDVIQIPSFGLSYGLTDRLEIGANIPLISRRGISEGELEAPGEAEIEVLGNSFGFGDITISAQYHAITQNHSFADVALKFGVKLPTGQTNELDQEDDRFETEFQPGSGSVDFSFGAVIGKDYGPWSVNAAAEYTLATTGSQDTNLGDTVELGAALSYGWQFGNGRSLTLAGELLFQDQEQEIVGEEADINSGGTQLFIAPSVRYSFDESWGIFGGIAFPIVEDLNGIQNDTDFRLTTGVSVSF